MSKARGTAPNARRASAFGLFAALLATALLAGCASQAARLQANRPSDLPVRVELVETPFFPDESHFCGPAALATSLTAVGLPTKPETLIGQIFLPGRGGTLQVEMLAGARRNGAVATVIPGALEALMRETAAGNPVVVLQNLGLSWAPAWHYAVVVGYDLDGGHMLLRSGPIEREMISLRTFEYTWNRGDRWAFVALPPGRLPITAGEVEATRALVQFERNAPAVRSAEAYRSGLARWPGNATLAMGLGNTLYASGDLPGAEAVFRQAAETHDLAAAYNNRAHVLLELGRHAEARRAAERGLHVAGPLRRTLMETLDAIEKDAAEAPRR